MKPGPAIAAGALLIVVWGFRVLAPYEAVVPPGDRAAVDAQAAISQLTLGKTAPHETPPPDDGAALIAAARADAASLWKQTDARRAARIARAKAVAAERVDFARGITATIVALQTRMDANTRPAILEDLYRDKIAEILKKAGSVSTVDPKSVSRLILPDPSP